MPTYLNGVEQGGGGGAGGDAVITVAANNTPAAQKARADFTCPGANDEATIQALVAAGVAVKLMVGDYIFNASLNILVSNFRLEGSGPGTTISGILAVPYIRVGNNATALEDITICDLEIDGTAQTAGAGILLDGAAGSLLTNMNILNCQIEYCDEEGINGEYCVSSLFESNYCMGNDEPGISLDNCDYCRVADNLCKSSYTRDGILLYACDNCTVTGNDCNHNDAHGIKLDNSTMCTVTGNTCDGNDLSGISVSSGDWNTVSGNTCTNNSSYGITIGASDLITVTGNTVSYNGTTTYSGIRFFNCLECTVTGNAVDFNGNHGIELQRTSHCTISGNVCNSSRSAAGIYIEGDATANSDYNHVSGNNCYNNTTYGIQIVGGVDANNNRVINNKLTSNTTAPFADAGTNTMLATYVVPFIDGTDPQDSGFLIDDTTEMARAYLRLPPEVQQVVRMEVYARAVAAETHEMELEMVVKGGADNEPYATHDGSIANLDSISVNFAADDVIFWRNIEAGTLALLGGDSVEVKVLHAPVEGENLDTQAYFRTVEIQYV